MIEAGLVATGMQGFWVRAVVGLVFLAAVIFHLTMEDPTRLRRPARTPPRRPAPAPTDPAGAGAASSGAPILRERP